jgi:hypothetical protein
MVREGRFRRNRQSASSALECGRLRLWVIGLFRNGILFMCLEPPRLSKDKVSVLKRTVGSRSLRHSPPEGEG